MDIIARAASCINKYRMLSGGETVLIALSGGPDSTCLAIAMSRLADDLKLTLHAAYIDHGLRPDETPDEEAHSAELCKRLSIAFHTRRIDVLGQMDHEGLNKHEAARALRYHALEELAGEFGAKRIAIGHNLDDQCETFFMRAIRGSGPTGLAAIPPVRHNLIRPLIETSRSEIEAFLRSEGVSATEDSSNQEDVYLRNRFRHHVMPMLAEMNPSIRETIGRTAEILAEEERYFFIQVTKALMRLIPRKTDDEIELFVTPLESMDPVILRRVIRRALDETRGLRGIGHAHIDDIVKLIRAGGPGQSVDLPGRCRAIRKYSTILLTSGGDTLVAEREITGPGAIDLPEAGLRIEASLADQSAADADGKGVCVMDAALVPFPLKVRARQDGDFFYPSGLGHRKKLQDFFTDIKLPRHERGAVPIIVTGDEIAWVAGHRADGRFAPTERTSSYLILRLTKPAGSGIG